MVTRRLRAASAALLLAAVSTLAACGSSTSSGGGETGTVTVGIVNSYTGAISMFGPAFEAGFRAGLDELTNGTNEVDGTKIKIVVKDDAMDPATGLAAAKELIGDGAKAIVGTSSSAVVVPVAQTAIDNKVLMIAGGTTSPDITAMGPGVFRSQVDVYTVNNAVLQMIKSSGGSKVAYLGQDYAYGQSQAKGLAAQGKELGVTVTPELLPVSTQDFTAGVAKVLSSGVDSIYVGWTGEGQTQLYQALVDQGAFAANSKVHVTALAPVQQNFASVAAAIGDEALKNFQLVTTYAKDSTGVPAEKVMDKFVADGKSKAPIDTQQASGYLAAAQLVKALKDAGPDLAPDAVHKALAGASFDVLQGTVKIRAEDHMPLASMFEYRLVKDGSGYKLQQVKEFAADTIAAKVDKVL